jgi:hypothetical protein
MSKEDLNSIIKKVEETVSYVDNLENKNSFSKYIIQRNKFIKMAYLQCKILLNNALKKKTLSTLRNFIDPVSEFMICDKAYPTNLYHHLKTKFDNQLDKKSKQRTLDEIDFYVKPQSGKSIYINKFASGYLTYKLAYENEHTSKAEARELSSYLFNLSDTSVRENTAKVINAIESNLSFYKKYSMGLDALLFYQIDEAVTVKKHKSFHDLLEHYQNNISQKSKNTTEKTINAYYKIKEDALNYCKNNFDIKQASPILLMMYKKNNIDVEKTLKESHVKIDELKLTMIITLLPELNLFKSIPTKKGTQTPFAWVRKRFTWLFK